jgi:glycosyltransferase involved in cell wall biosynthesis
MAQILRLEAPDVVHCNSVGGRELLVGALCSRYRIPSTVKFASDFVWEWVNRERLRVGSIEEAHRFNWRARALSVVEKYGLRSFSLVWATSRYREGTLRDQLGIDSTRIRVIPNRIRLPGPAYRVDYDKGSARPTYLITGGRLVPHKRLEETLAGVAGLEREDVVLRLYGGGDERQEARARDAIAELGLDGRVERYRGLRYDEVLNLMAGSDLYVSSSIEEGFGITLVEAMAVGLPVIAARTSAVPETVPDRKAGILYESGNLADFVSATGELIDDPDMRRSLGEFGHEHAKQFSIDRGVDPYCKLFEDALAA